MNPLWVPYKMDYPYLAEASSGFFKFYYKLDSPKWDAVLAAGELIVVFSRSYRGLDDAYLVLTHRGLGWVKMPYSYSIVRRIL